MNSVLQFIAAIDLPDSLTRISWLTLLIIILIALIVLFIARRIVDDIVEHFLRSHSYSSPKERQQRRDTLVAVFTTIVTVIISAVAFVMVLVELGVDLAAAAASLGALGVVLGLAGQSLFKNFFSGLMIIADNQMRVNDIVTIAGVSGVIEELKLMTTRLRDLDGNVHIVPNGEITVVTNHSLGFANVNLDVGVSYDTDIDKVERIINQVGNSMDGEKEWDDIINKPIQFLRVDSFGDSSVNIKALGEVVPGTQWDVAGEFRRRLKVAFDKAGIEIPFPQRVIHTMSDSSKKASK